MRTYIKYIKASILLLWACISAEAQEVYRTEIIRNDVKSLEIKVGGELISTPYAELDGEKNIEISFDALHRSGGRFAYSVIHCDADWKKSELLPIEYMKGFQHVAIEDFANSMNATTHYTNYKLSLPNEDTQLAVSGNYAILVYEEDTPEKIVFTACFSMVEPLIEIDASISGNTDIDFNKSHQQVEFTVNQANINITYPQSDLKIFVYQNNNLNDVRRNMQPMTINNRQLQYKHNRELIFEAGNEYRRIEFLTHRYNGMGVEATDFHNPYYHVTLMQDKKRDKKTYLYDQDQNGRFFIRCSECEDPDTEADYFIVHFSLVSELMPNGKMYIFGDLFNNILDNRSLMEYNMGTGAYEKAVMLKTGLYNYQYIFIEDGDTKASFSRTEGNFFETENEYNIAVYYRPVGARYDRLIGYKKISSKHGHMQSSGRGL
ncbi:MAG: DUF5103 domain-containing protein [Tannerella sp.]|nr:DUF5103 domain-containing protein [Tannerella sp.]